VKGIGGIIVYLLLIIGAVAMLMPFAWMVVTSIKLPSEVEQWPPQWGTKNFLSKREVKVIKEYSSNTLVLNIDDDAFLRGKVHVLFASNPMYSDDIPKEKFNLVYEKYKALFSKKPSDFENTGDFIAYQLKTLEGYLAKTKFHDTVISSIEKSLGYLSTISRMINIRVKNAKDKGELASYVKRLQSSLAELKLKMEDIYSAVSLHLTEREIEEVLKHYSDFENHIKPSPDIQTKQAKLLLRFVDLKALKPLDSSFKPYSAYMDIFNVLKEIQKGRFRGKELVARFKTKDEKYESLKNAFSKDYPWIWKKIREKAKKSPEALWNTIASLLESKKEKENEEILSEIENRLSSSAAATIVVLQDIEELVEKCFDVAYGKNINFESYMKYDRVEDFVNNYTEDVLEVAKNMDEYKEFYKMEGLKTSLNAIKSIAKRLKKNLSVDPMSLIKKVYYMDRRYKKEVDDVKSRYIDSVDTMVILKNPAPDVIKSVKTLIFKGKDMTKENISIDLSVHSINFYDDNVRVAVFFSFGEIVKNIFQNYIDAWHAAPFGRYYINTVFVASVTTICEVILASMAAFAFAILKFPGRDFIFSLFLATMMVPGEVLLVPNFITITKLGWIDTYYALIIPWIVSVFAIFLIRQHFLTLPRELYDASKIDGCSSWRYLWTIAVPLSKPVIITGALLKFVGSWNAFLWVLIVTNSDKYRTLPVGLHTFSSEAGTVYNQLMAASTFSVLPVILLFLFLQKYFIRGIARSGLK